MSVEGVNQIVRKLQRLRDDGADKAMLAGSRAAAKVLEKGMRDAIPGQYREARKGIGRRVRKKRGEIQAKVGAGVGKRNVSKRSRSGRGGVGLSKANIHWAILGVRPRFTKRGQYRGRHDGFLAGVVQQGASTAELRAAVAMQAAVKAELEKATR